MNGKSISTSLLLLSLFFIGSCGGLSTSGSQGANEGSATSLTTTGERCRSFDSNGRCLDDREDNDRGRSIRMEWGAYKNHISGLAASQYVEGFKPTGSDYRGNYCFSNNLWRETNVAGSPFSLNCAKPSADLRSTINYQPVAIQSFRLKLAKKNYHSVTFQGASVKTAVLEFNTRTGAPVFKDKVTSTFGDGCSLNHANAVGFDESRSGEERIMTSVQFFDEYDVCHTNVNNTIRDFYCRAYLTAGKLWYSGLIPFASSQLKFQFDYVPASRPESQTFGGIDYSGVNAADVTTLPQFGAHADDAGGVLNRYSERVITGLCIRGYKQRTSASSTKRNLFVGAKIRTHRPQLTD